ncbi:MAG: OstA family protein, partial [Sphingobacteriales bacterium]|nr:OstA family protein [Sphingobacteriales bacterium]
FSGVIKSDSVKNATKDTLKQTTVIKPSSSDTIRYFEAFHHVRIFNDSVQSVCDSLFYSSEDSVFRMYNQPIVFSHKSQITGDTIYLYTKNQKADKIRVFENALIINKTNEQLFNQIGGRTINGYFKDGGFNYMRVKGSPAQSIFYPQDSDSAYTGMNKSKGDVIDIYFIENELNKIKFINDVDGTLYPMRQIPEEEKYLRGYKWHEGRRPKTKFELYE